MDLPVTADLHALKARMRGWARELGFQQLGVAGVDLGEAEARLLQWLDRGFAGEMAYLARHGTRRSRPAELIPGTLRVVSVRMNYLPQDVREAQDVLDDGTLAYVSRYALGRDYHKVVRTRLQQLAARMQEEIGAFNYRVFTDSAPVMEVELARMAGLGWRGKHSLLLDRGAGSWFFLGEIYTDLPLPIDAPLSDHCGSCSRCIEVCPTGAIVEPYLLDARRCISYLTIEHPGSIPEPLRPLLGNRIYGCDDCQLVCPWNKFASTASIDDFAVRNGLDGASLAALFGWSADEFEARLAGSPIRRIGHERWLRNIAVALGNAPASRDIVSALEARRAHPSALVREHVEWALGRHAQSKSAHANGGEQ
ncbi:MAG TPA: tRNA epoxyqueuosine(34) reductase QueG [Burkholderiales bacterium]|nr:tRNA epoxyqueuosine(34) reductase QueG [Burkholderiales bacterium]